MINYQEIIIELEKLTKQKCNIFTLLHYCSNGYLDIFIKKEFDICKVRETGFKGDDDYYVIEIEDNYNDYLRVDMERVDTLKLSTVLIKNDESIEIHSVMKKGYLSNYVLLKTPIYQITNRKIKEFHALKDCKEIELSLIVAEVGLGQDFTKEDFLFDQEQILNIPLSHPAQNRDHPFFAPELGFAMNIWEQLYVKEKGVFLGGVTRLERIDKLIKEFEIETTKAKSGLSNLSRFKDRMNAVVNPSAKVKISK